MKKNNVRWLIIFAAIVIVGFVLTNTFVIGLCAENDFGCDLKIGEGVALPMWFGGLAVLIPLIVLLFMRPEVFETWSRFARVAIPLAVIWIALTPVQSGSSAIASLGIGDDRESAALITAILFLIISLVIIVKSSRAKEATK